MCWAWLLQVGRALAPIIVTQFLNGPLERGFHSFSISCLYKTSADGFSTLELVSCARAGRARAYLLALEQVVLFGVSSGREKSTLERTGFRARADVLYSCVLALERALLRSSVSRFLFLALERCVLRSSGSYVYELSAG